MIINLLGVTNSFEDICNISSGKMLQHKLRIEFQRELVYIPPEVHLKLDFLEKLNSCPSNKLIVELIVSGF